MDSQLSNTAEPCGSEPPYGTLSVMLFFKKQFTLLYSVKFAPYVNAVQAGVLPAAFQSTHDPTQLSSDPCLDTPICLDPSPARSIWQNSSNVCDSDPDVFVSCVLLMAGQLRNAMPLVGTADEALVLGAVLVPEAMSVGVAEGIAELDAALDAALVVETGRAASVPPTAPPTTPPMTMNAMTTKTAIATPFLIPHILFLVRVWNAESSTLTGSGPSS
jgi:hypothetical protein